tara:strand:- start:510 stop:1499 length:990 start_codon:yes stop_codon:yes gene_type:complete
MGAMCATSTINLPSYGQTVGGTTLPAWVSAGGRSLFEQSAELAKSPYPLYQGQRIASYDGSKLTPEEQQAAELLAGSAGEYQPYIDKATELAGGLGKGYGATSREDLIGSNFSLESAQPFLDIYQGAQDAAVREIGDQTTLQQNQARASAAKSGAFGGSRLGITEAMLGSEGAQAAGDLRSRAAAEGLGFAANRFDTDRAARFSAEDAARSGYETDESSRLRQQEIYQNMAPLVQGLREQTAAGLMSTGEAKRRLDQMALDMAYADYQDQRQYPYEQINFALGTLQGTPYNTQNYGYNMAQQYAQGPSVYGQTIGALGTLGAGYFAGKN